jgi:murein endopeptidase
MLALALGPSPAAPQSRALGQPSHGHLVRGVQLPAYGAGFATWDPVRKQVGNREWRRWGTHALVNRVERVLATYARRHPDAPPVLVGDLSRTHGGDFGAEFGGLGHASHQNGLDADIYYPRLDLLERRAYTPSQVDQELAQDLVDRFLAAGARVIYVGPHLRLTGPRKKVVPLAFHDDHMHVRLQLRG